MSARKQVRVHEWVNTETFEPLYGVQVRRNGKWLHMVSGKSVALFPTREEAETLVAETIVRLASAAEPRP